MQEKFDQHESSEKPLWNKQAVWDKIEEAAIEKERKPYAFGWFKLAVACILLIFGLLFLRDFSLKSGNSISSHNTPNEIIRHTRDTIFKIVADTQYVIQKKTIRDTIWLPQNRLVIHDTLTRIKEVWVEKQMETSGEKKDIKPARKESHQIIYSFNKPIGEYVPKSQVRFKLLNKAPYPGDNQTRETFIVQNR